MPHYLSTDDEAKPWTCDLSLYNDQNEPCERSKRQQHSSIDLWNRKRKVCKRRFCCFVGQGSLIIYLERIPLDDLYSLSSIAMFSFLLCFFLLVSLVATLATATIVATATIDEKIMDEKRFVVFNSRQLTGECGK